ncbi:hypothetical protein Avbf_01202 [Armadillidium vulgare]|nr:hypothetical protein Avbf_01202 [Armadillidium vulgare]
MPQFLSKTFSRIQFYHLSFAILVRIKEIKNKSWKEWLNLPYKSLQGKQEMKLFLYSEVERVRITIKFTIDSF